MPPGSQLTPVESNDPAVDLKADGKTATILTTSNAPKCAQCGHEASDSDTFCIYCGVPINCDSKNPQDEVIEEKETPIETDILQVTVEPENIPIDTQQTDSFLDASNTANNRIEDRPSTFQNNVASLDQLWVPDSFSSNCMDCKAPFGFPKPRRHHCRVCGLLFCRSCLQNKISVPKSFGYGDTKERCCRACVTALQVKSITSPADVFAQRKTLQNPPSETTQPEGDAPRSKCIDESSQCSYLAESAIFDSSRVDQSECQVCFRPFKFKRRQHHCRRCTRIVCNNCSEGMKPILELGFPQPVRHCSSCLTNPPAFIQPVMEPVTKPPTGFEYLARLDIRISVTGSQSDEIFTVKTFCEPNAQLLSEIQYNITDTEKAIVNDYHITYDRTFSDFEWLFVAFGSHANAKALPYFPDRRSIRNERDKAASMLQNFLFGCLLHPLLRDADCLKAFLVLKDLKAYKSQSKPLYETDTYSNVITALRLEFERAQVIRKVDTLKARELSRLERIKEQKSRLQSQQIREDNQVARREQAMIRFQSLENRNAAQKERITREKDRYLQQANQTHILFFDAVEDAAIRKQEEEKRELEKLEFQKSKDMFQNDTAEWNRNMALWSKHRANWSEQHNPAVSRDIANEWILKFYGVFPSKEKEDEVPKELIELHAEMETIQKTEPSHLDEEGASLDDEWMRLAKEREHWASDRGNMRKEDEMYKEEDSMYRQEHDYVAQEVAVRESKIKVIEKDLETLQQQILSRKRILAQRRERHQALNEEFENEWKVMLQLRVNGTKLRLKAHENRMERASKRSQLFADQLARQQQSERMLCFKRSALMEEQKADAYIFEEHQEDSRLTLQACENARSMTPEYIQRLQADMKNRLEELKSVLDSNKRTAQEGTDESMDERDAFMNSVRKRRQEFQSELEIQQKELKEEETLCTLLLDHMKAYQTSLEEEIEDGTIEDSLIANFKTLMEKEKLLLNEEEQIRAQKKNRIHDAISDAGTWVMEAVHEHSKRKKNEANRLVRQAHRAAELQKLVQHFTHRVIDEEERIMRQKQRIINCEHKIEMLKAADNWYEYVKELGSPDYGKKDWKKMEAGRVERMEDLKEAAQLQKEDEADMKQVAQQLDMCQSVALLKEEKRAVWAQVEQVYSVSKPQEKDEDLMMTCQIRDLLQQLAEAFEMLNNRLLEEDESLQHAEAQLNGEIESIKMFMERMEKEEGVLGSTEKTSLTKESQVNRSESDLIKQRARALIETYQDMLLRHQEYPAMVDKVQASRAERARPGVEPVSEMEAVKKLVKSRNYYDARACSEFARKFKLDREFKEVRPVLDWLRNVLDQEIRKCDAWTELSRKDRKSVESIKIQASEVDWTRDTLSRIPALEQVQHKLALMKRSTSSDRKNMNAHSEVDNPSLHPDEQWIKELLDLKQKISKLDANALQMISKSIDSARKDEKSVASTLQQLIKNREYVLNTLRFIDQEEARAIRIAGKVSGSSRPTSTKCEESGSEDITSPCSNDKRISSGRSENSGTKLSRKDVSSARDEKDIASGTLPGTLRTNSSTAAASAHESMGAVDGVRMTSCCAFV